LTSSNLLRHNDPVTDTTADAPEPTAAPGDQVVTWSGTFPADWPEELCQAQIAMNFYEGLDLRRYRHLPIIRTAIQHSRTATTKAFRAMLQAHDAS
jgi:hypothetical protein